MASLRQYNSDESPSIEIGFTRNQLEVLERLLTNEYDKLKDTVDMQATAVAHILLEVEEGLDILGQWDRGERD